MLDHRKKTQNPKPKSMHDEVESLEDKTQINSTSMKEADDTLNDWIMDLTNKQLKTHVSWISNRWMGNKREKKKILPIIATSANILDKKIISKTLKAMHKLS